MTEIEKILRSVPLPVLEVYSDCYLTMKNGLKKWYQLDISEKDAKELCHLLNSNLGELIRNKNRRACGQDINISNL